MAPQVRAEVNVDAAVEVGSLESIESICVVSGKGATLNASILKHEGLPAYLRRDRMTFHCILNVHSVNEPLEFDIVSAATHSCIGKIVLTPVH